MADRKSDGPNGIKIHASTKALKLILIIIAALGVGGSSAHYVPKLFNNSGGDKGGHKSDVQSSSDLKKDVETNTKDIKTIKTHVGNIETDVSSIKNVQIENVASSEARRVMEKTKGPNRLQDYDRLLRLNRERLKRTVPAPPCSNKDCTN